MKTNVVMRSTDRELFGVKIKQETKTGFLNLSDLQEAFAKVKVQKGWTDRDIFNIMSSRFNIERIYYILEKQQLIKPSFNGFMEEVEKQGVVKVLKQYNAYKATGARQTKTTWCNPYIWVLIAMEMNPELYATAVMWLTDSLLINRIEAGNLYKELSKSITRFNDVDYVRLAKGLNYIIFGRHEAGIRNTATQSELKELEKLEAKLSFAINMGYIKSFASLIDELYKIYNQTLNSPKQLK